MIIDLLNDMKIFDDENFVSQFVDDLFISSNSQSIEFFNFFQIFDTHFDIENLNIYNDDKNVFVSQRNSQLFENQNNFKLSNTSSFLQIFKANNVQFNIELTIVNKFKIYEKSKRDMFLN